MAKLKETGRMGMPVCHDSRVPVPPPSTAYPDRLRIDHRSRLRKAAARRKLFSMCVNKTINKFQLEGKKRAKEQQLRT